MMAGSRLPPVLWAQREKELYLTINLTDVHNEKLDLSETQLYFEGESKGQVYSCTLEFCEPVDLESVTPRNIFLVIAKKEEKYWPRLLKTTQKMHFIKTDFSRWKDEDEEEEEEMMGGMPGMPGMEGLDFSQFAKSMNASQAAALGDEGEESDSDDEMPPLAEQTA